MTQLNEEYPLPPGGHEPDAVNARGPLWFAVALGGLVVGALALMYGTLSIMVDRLPQAANRADLEPPAPIAGQPALNPDQGRELARLREREDARLASYGWTDKAEGIAHIPIDKAIETLSIRGFDRAAPEKRDGN